MNSVQKYDKVLFNIPIPLYFYSKILDFGEVQPYPIDLYLNLFFLGTAFTFQIRFSSKNKVWYTQYTNPQSEIVQISVFFGGGKACYMPCNFMLRLNHGLFIHDFKWQASTLFIKGELFQSIQLFSKKLKIVIGILILLLYPRNNKDNPYYL